MNKYDYKDPETFNEEDYNFYQDDDERLWCNCEIDSVYSFVKDVSNFHYNNGDNYFEMMQLIGRAKDILRKRNSR